MSTVRTFIYGLVDPRSDQVRYVGRSIQPRQRLQGHLGTCTNTLVQGWVGELRTQGLRPSLKILATVVHEADVSPIEQALIVAYDARGVGVLNIRGVLRVQPRVGPPARWRMRHAPPMAPTPAVRPPSTRQPDEAEVQAALARLSQVVWNSLLRLDEIERRAVAEQAAARGTHRQQPPEAV